MSDTFGRWLQAVGVDERAPELSRWLRRSMTGFASEISDSAQTDTAGLLPPRYEDRGLLGVGGMGEVRRVYDRLLCREIALKALHPALARLPTLMTRFHREAEVTAGLVHPAIIPVHDLGVLGDGRPYFTMRVVEGEALHSVIGRVHLLATPDGWRETPDGWNLPRLIDALVTSGEALAFAHTRGLIHRDFKPDNVLVGAHAEVLVVDWGLVRLEVGSGASPGESVATLHGDVQGTPAYMAPEQACGESVEEATDAWALGASLYEVLANRPPWRGATTRAVLEAARGALLPSLPTGGPPVPEELALLLRAVLVRDPARRPGIRAIVADLRRWRDGEGRRALARTEVHRARTQLALLDQARSPAEQARRDADARLAAVPQWAPVAEKASAWAEEDAALAVGEALRRGEQEVDDLLTAALAHDPDCVEAHALSCERLRATHRAAETAGDAATAELLTPRIRRHALALPESHATRRAIDRYLAGKGALTVLPDPPDARVTIRPWLRLERRLVPGAPILSVRGPLHAVELPVGRWLVELDADGCEPVRVPMEIGREDHWSGVPPGESAPFPILLPRSGELGPEDCYVPAGWCTVGGDPVAPGSLPRDRVWVDGLVMRRFPVRNAEYLHFLDGLVAIGREHVAEQCAPRERGAGVRGPRIYGRDDLGRHALVPDADGDLWQPDWPVVMVHHVAAWTYARWEAARTGQPWRLPAELEWEKAARGGDGRLMPWGDYADPSWYSGSRSFPGRAFIETVFARPVDESPYGVRCLAGHVVEWTADRMRPEGPPLQNGRVRIPNGSEDGEQSWMDHTAAHRIVGRGGSWATDAKFARCAFRTALEPWLISSNVGIRIARSFGPRV